MSDPINNIEASEALQTPFEVDESTFKRVQTIKACAIRFSTMATLILFYLIRQFPQGKSTEDGYFIPDHNKIQKELHLTSQVYWHLVEKLVSDPDYPVLLRMKRQRSLFFKIDFFALEAVRAAHEELVNSIKEEE